MFRTPAEPKAGDVVTVRFRTAAEDAEAVYLVRGEERFAMEKRKAPWQKKEDAFDYYAIDLPLGKETIAYHFEILRGGEIWSYNRQGPVWVCEPADDFRIIPDFSTPAWAKGAVFYQIFPDRFRNGDPKNDVRSGEVEYLGAPVEGEADFSASVREPDVGRFFGGDLAGIIEKLDYLADLGIEGLYLNPIFVSPSNHKYDTQDYDHVDPHLGKIVNDGDYVTRTTDAENLAASDAPLEKLIREAHKRGIRVILDGVFNHCGSFHKWIDREGIYAEAARRAEEADGAEKKTAEKTEGAEKAERAEKIGVGAWAKKTSPYRDYFSFENEEGWPENDSFEGWWDHKTLPKLNYEGSEKLQEEILRIAKKWISKPYDADGWRLDVAADLGHSPDFNHSFWKKFRDSVKKTKPEALILAEHYGYPGDWLGGDEWDSVMNYDAFMEPVSWIFTGMEKHSDACVPELMGDVTAFRETTRRANAAFGGNSLLVAMNELDNHDHSRFLTRTTHAVGRLSALGEAAAAEGADVAILRQAVCLQMTWPGMPTLYYGDEAGLCGFTDPDNRRPFPWGAEDKDLLAFYKAAIALHKRYDALRTGSLAPVPALRPDAEGTDPSDEVPGVLAYTRFNEREAILAVFGTGKEFEEVDLPVLPLGLSAGDEGVALARVFTTEREGWREEKTKVIARNDRLRLAVAPGSAQVFYVIIAP